MHFLLRDFRLDSHQVRDKSSCHGTDCGADLADLADLAAGCLGGSAGVFHGALANCKGYGLVEKQIDKMHKI